MVMVSVFVCLWAFLSAGAAASAMAKPASKLLSLPVTRTQSNADPGARARAARARGRRSTDLDITTDLGASYTVQLGFGTPAQTVDLILDTGSSELWVNPNCDKVGDAYQRQECRADGHYDPASSSTETELDIVDQIEYGSGLVELAYVKDRVSLPGSDVVLHDIVFGTATDSDGIPSGILGVSFGGDTRNLTLPYSNFIDELYRQNMTSSRAFSVALGSIDGEADDGGTVLFGGVDTKKFSGKMSTHRILPAAEHESGLARYWLQMTSMSLVRSGNSTPYAGSKIPVVMDTGSTLCSLPDAIVGKMRADFNGQIDPDSGTIYVNCQWRETKGSIDFTFDSATFTCPLSDFIWNAGTRGLDACVLGARSTKLASGQGESIAILGASFLRSAYVLFDQDQGAISMAPHIDCGSNPLPLPAGAGAVAGFTGECSATSVSSTGRRASAALTWRMAGGGTVGVGPLAALVAVVAMQLLST